jgi:hypothetical protein
MAILRKRTGAAECDVPPLRKVLPALPLDVLEYNALANNLTRMGCAGLMNVPWGFKERHMVEDLLGEPSNEFAGTIRGRPELWTKETWAEVYAFRSGGLGLTTRKEDFLSGEFAGKADPKEGHAIADCKDAEARTVLAFLIPIFYPEKPTRVTNTWASTILGAFRMKRRVDWALLMHELVSKLVKALPKAKSTPLSSYLAHLYHFHDFLRPEERASWETQACIRQYGGTESDSDSEAPGPDVPESSSPVRQGVKRKMTPQSEVRREQPEPAVTVEPAPPLLAMDGDPWRQIQVALGELSRQNGVRDGILGSLVSLVGSPDLQGLVKAVEQVVAKAKQVDKLEEEASVLRAETEQLRNLLRKRDEEVRDARARAKASAPVFEEVKEAFSLPVEVVNKARLFDAKLDREDHMSKSRIIRFLVDQSRRMESAVDRLRHIWDNFQPVRTLQPEGTVATPPSSGGARGPGSGEKRVRPNEESPSRRRQVVPLTSSGSSQGTAPTPPSVQRPQDSSAQSPSPSLVEMGGDLSNPTEEGQTTPFQFRTPLVLRHSPIPIPAWTTRVEDPNVSSRVLRSAGSPNSTTGSPLTRSTPPSNERVVSVPNPGMFSPITRDTSETFLRTLTDEEGRRWRMEP